MRVLSYKCEQPRIRCKQLQKPVNMVAGKARARGGFKV